MESDSRTDNRGVGLLIYDWNWTFVRFNKIPFGLCEAPATGQLFGLSNYHLDCVQHQQHSRF